MRNTAIVRWRSACAASRRRKAVASTAPSARKVLRPRKRSSKNAFSPPSSSMCASLAALARQPTSAMNKGIKGAASTSTSAATQESVATVMAMTGSTSITRQRAGW